MKATSLIYVVIVGTMLCVSMPCTKGQEMEKVQERIRQIVPVSDMLPVAITTIRYGNVGNPALETKTITKGVRQKYKYDFELPLKTPLGNSSYECWFLSIGLNDSEPSAQQYGIWLTEYPGGIKDDDYALHIFPPREQYLLWKGGSGFFIKNICNPIDMSTELEKGMNTETRLRPEYAISFYLDHSGILKAETEYDARKAKIVSFNKTPDGGFCLTVESPKSKSVFVFVIDKEATDQALKDHNSQHERLKTPPPGMVRWKMNEFMTPAGAKTNKQFRNWFFPSESGEYHHVAKYVSCDGKNVTLEKENGEQITIELTQLRYDSASQNYIKFVLTVEAGGEETEAIRSLDFRLPPSRE